MKPQRPLQRILCLASRKDRAWFDQHPGESVRYRPLLPGEFGPASGELAGEMGRVQAVNPEARTIWMVEVNQIAPGIRTRRPYLVIEPASEGVSA